MKEKFCPSCGEETQRLFDGLCEECFREREKLAELPETLDITQCSICKKFKIDGKWRRVELEEAVRKAVQKEAKFKEGLAGREIEIEDLSTQRPEVKIIVKGEMDGLEISEEEVIEIKLEKECCKACSRRTSGYYQAKLQIRGKEEKVSEAIQTVKRVLDESRGKNDFVSGVEETENGLDLFLGSSSLARKILREISKEYETERKSTKTLHGRKEGEDVYRSTYLLRILD